MPRDVKDTQLSYDNPAYTNGGEEINMNGKHSRNAVDPKQLHEEKTAGKSDESEDNIAEVKTVGVFEVFRFATSFDVLLMVLGLLTAMVLGASMPVILIIFGDMTDNFVTEAAIENLLDEYWDKISLVCNGTRDDVLEDPTCIENFLINTNNTEFAEDYQWIIDGMEEDFIEELNEKTIYYVIVGCVVLVVGYITLACFMASAYRQGQRIRTLLFQSILRQEIGWFDTHDSGELNTRLADDVSKIQDGLGDKLASFLRYSAQFFGGYIVGFIYGWELTLVITAASPLIMISGAIMSQLGVALTQKELNAYAKAGSIAEEVLSSIRTVVAFGGEQKECSRYNENLTEAKDFGVKKSFVAGLGSGLVYGILFCSYGLAFWYGSRLVRESLREGNDTYTAGTMMTVFYGVLVGAFSVGIAAPNIAYFSAARGAAYTVFNIIDMEPAIDSSSKKGKKLEKIVGNIEFRDVHFRYPSRPDVPILKGFSAHINVGHTVALVGASGCGKSTTVQLLQRFYDPEKGQVLIDGVDITELNVQWLRRQIGVVSQEPILFATTIGENIRYGREGVTMDEIEEAAINANAHSFIMKLPQKYDTLVGERGAQLSGGQKQRIAIARALVRNPKILLLDEATSALDMESESIVQSALDKARAGRTTIVVAHRLSTIRTADVICGVDRGVISEQGTHEELMELGQIYHTLVTNQTLKEEEEKEQLELGLKEATKNDDEVVFNEDAATAPIFGRGISTVSDRVKLARSMSVVSEKGDKEEEDYIPSFAEILKLNSSEWHLIMLGCIGAFITGVLQPTFAYIFAEIITVFAIPDLEQQKDESNLYALMFVGIGFVNACSMSLEGYMFGKSGEILTLRLRKMCFRGFLRQDLSYFDYDHHSTGALCTRLSNDASAVQGATGAQLGMFIRSVSSLVGGIVIGMIYSWKLTLVFMAFAPFMIASGFLEMSLMKGSAQADKEALESAGKIAVEGVENIRTVTTLTKEDMFFQDYCEATGIPYKKNLVRVHLRAVSFAISQSFVFFAFAGGFRYGAYLIEEEGLAVEDMFKVFGAVVFSAMMAGQVSAFGPDVGKAKLAAGRIMTLFEREPLIDSFSTSGKKPKKVKGKVSFSDVHFNYPTRPNVKILQGLELEVNPGQTLALVGASGCGKSTTVQLIERFYDPKSGGVELDGHDTTSLNVSWLRSQMGLVSQEPILFDTTIKDNIAYGDNSRIVSMEEVIEAARKANIHSFIASLPEGYDTNTGSKGTQLSGGQKQRIAIARALVRNPKILLLDEATSALDTESEKVVQEALDNARAGRTSIVIAHRLSTIYNADIIAVIHNGQVAEQGTHSELLAMKGLYYKLNTIQSRG